MTVIAHDLPAIRAALAAYRSTATHITEAQITAAWSEYEATRDQLRGAVSETERLRHEVQARDDVIYHAAEHLRRALDAIAAYEDRITDVGGQ
jgi:septal ring factor EnvC (AmiA/AmiB activator)